jgi:hypothetical protein
MRRSGGGIGTKDRTRAQNRACPPAVDESSESLVSTFDAVAGGRVNWTLDIFFYHCYLWKGKGWWGRGPLLSATEFEGER